MNRHKSANPPQATPDRAGTFVERLLAVNERLMREGLAADDVVAAVGIAQFFPGIFAAAYDSSGRYVWASESFSSVLDIPCGEVLGKALTELFDSDWCRERTGLIQRVLASGMPVFTVEIFRGRRLEAAVLPVDIATSSPAVMLVGRFGIALSSRAGGDDSGAYAKAELLETADWGPLAVLTRRELEVLRLVASGLDNQGIADRIHRTKRAVEWHMNKLYDYLNCNHRTDLFRFGLVAGLPDIDDKHWERMMARVRVEDHVETEPDK